MFSYFYSFKNTEEPVEKPTEEPVEKPTEEPVEKPTEEPVEKPTEEPPESLPSLRYKPITDDPVLANLKPQRVLIRCHDGTYGGYDDAYTGVIVWDWEVNDMKDYFSLHLDPDEWFKIVEILSDCEIKFEIISDLPDGAKSGNFLEALARSYFGLHIDY